MKLHNLDLNLLLVLDVVLRECSVSRAARHLDLTQPAISSALQRLRAHFQDDILVQVGRRMIPTPFAESIAPSVKGALEELRRIATMRAEFDPAIAQRAFTFVCSDYVFLVFLSRAVRELATIAPNVRLYVYLTSEATRRMLGEARADFLILPTTRRLTDHPFTPLFDDRFCCIAWTGNKMVGDEITLDDYRALQHVETSLDPSNPPHIVQETLGNQGITRTVVAYAPTFASVIEVVVGTDYVATVHERTARIFAERLPIKLLSSPVPHEPFVEALQWNAKMSGDPGIIWMRDFLLDLAAPMRQSGPADLRLPEKSAPAQPAPVPRASV